MERDKEPCFSSRSRSPIDCERVRRKTVKLTSPTPTTTMAMPTKAASKWSRLQAAKTKVTHRGGDKLTVSPSLAGGGKANENICRNVSCSTSARNYICVHSVWRSPSRVPRSVNLWVRSGVINASWRFQTRVRDSRNSLPRNIHFSVFPQSGSKHCGALPCAILAVIHCEAASVPPPSPILPPSRYLL